MNNILNEYRKNWITTIDAMKQLVRAGLSPDQALRKINNLRQCSRSTHSPRCCFDLPHVSKDQMEYNLYIDRVGHEIPEEKLNKSGQRLFKLIQ